MMDSNSVLVPTGMALLYLLEAAALLYSPGAAALLYLPEAGALLYLAEAAAFQGLLQAALLLYLLQPAPPALPEPAGQCAQTVSGLTIAWRSRLPTGGTRISSAHQLLPDIYR